MSLNNYMGYWQTVVYSGASTQDHYEFITAQAVKDQGYDDIATKVSECIERIKIAREK
jgi:hypothetical protein